MDSHNSELVENDLRGLHLRDTPNASIAEVQLGDVCGGKLLWSYRVSPTKNTWRTIDKRIKDSLTSYDMLDKFSEHDGVHDMASVGKNSRGVTGNNIVLTAEGWRLLFHELYQETSDLAKSPKGEKLRTFGLRLAMTAPKSIFEGGDWITDEDETIGLQSGLMTDAWTGAYMYFGAHWKQEDLFRDYLAPPGKMQAKSSLKTHSPFSASTALKKTQDADTIVLSDDDDMDYSTPAKDTATPATPVKKCAFARANFLDKDPTLSKVPLKQTKKKWNESRKFSSFIKIRTAKLKTLSRFDQEAEFLGIMQATLAKLWTLDPKLVIFPWKQGIEDSKPIQKDKAFPSCRDAFADFTERIFLKKGENVWVRLHVGHNKSLAALKDDRMIDHFRQKDMLAYKDTLQVKITAKAGWLLGSHATVLNPRDLEAVLAQLPEMSGLPVEIRTEWISLEKGDKLGIKAAHILCAWDSTLECRRALNAIYGKDMVEYPLGRNMRFIPNISDKRFLISDTTREKVVQSVTKQRLFTNLVSSDVSHIISNLDYRDKTIGMTLREALMQMRSKKSPARNLFLAVDMSWNESFVSFLFMKEHTAEVSAMLPALPLFFEHKLGATAWNWFKEDARKLTEGYWWCPKYGVQNSGEEVDDGWGDSLASDDDAGYWSSTSGASGSSRASGLSRASSATGGVFVEPFDITATAGKNEYDEGDGQSIGAWSNVTTVNDPDTDSRTITDTGTPVDSMAPASSPSPPAGSIDTSNAQDALLLRMRNDPTYAQEILRQFTAPPPPQHALPEFPPQNMAYSSSLGRNFAASVPPLDSVPPPLASVPPPVLGSTPTSTPLSAVAVPQSASRHPPASTLLPATSEPPPTYYDGEGPRE
jgi:hypothetical protein